MNRFWKQEEVQDVEMQGNETDWIDKEGRSNETVDDQLGSEQV